MSLLEHDIPWLTAEARNDPESAQRIVEALAQRAQTLQRQTDELRAENASLKHSVRQQVSGKQVLRLKTGLRDVRQLAERSGLNRDVVAMLTFSGHGLLLPAPAPFEQTFPLATTAEEPVDALKPVYLASGARLGSLLAITSNPRLALVFGFGLPLSEANDWREARPISELGLGHAERLEAVCPVDELRPPSAIVVVTRQGWVRVMSWPLIESLAVSGQAITLPGPGDTPVWLGPHDGEADLLLLTRNGRWTRFPTTMIPPGGCAGITLEPEDDVVSSAVLAPDARQSGPVLLCVGADGAILSVASSGLESHKKPGAKAAPLTRRFMAVACFVVGPRKTDAVLVLSNRGVFQVVSLKGLPIAMRLAEAQPLNVVNQRLVAATLL